MARRTFSANRGEPTTRNNRSRTRHVFGVRHEDGLSLESPENVTSEYFDGFTSYALPQLEVMRALCPFLGPHRAGSSTYDPEGGQGRGRPPTGPLGSRRNWVRPWPGCSRSAHSAPFSTVVGSPKLLFGTITKFCAISTSALETKPGTWVSYQMWSFQRNRAPTH
jgi:hypothetical protein